jgi:hypothetical protein
MKAVMRIYLFVSTTEPKIRGFTSDPTGCNLPADYAPWRSSGAGSAVPAGDHADLVSDAVARHGYFLVSGNVQRLAGRTTH